MIEPEQELRLQIVLRCFEVLRNVDEAVEAAVRLERYVRDGGTGVGSTREPGGALDAPAPPAGRSPSSSDTAAATPESRGVRRQGSGPKRRWNPQDEEILQEMWNAGDATADIARRLARTPASVRERARALKLTRRKAGRHKVERPATDDARQARAPSPAAPPAPVQASPPAGEPAARTPAPRAAAPAKHVAALAQAADGHTARRQTRKREKAGRAARKSGLGRGGGGARGASDLPDLRAHEVRRPETTLETVINFVRSRDYSVVWTPYGDLMVDARRNMAQDEFIDWANELRRRLGKSEFPCDLQRAG